MKASFHDKEDDYNTLNKDTFETFQIRKSKWTPPEGQFASLDFSIKKCRHSINKLKFLTITTPRTLCIYFLPKIHKPNNPGRPIVSACSCPTELISSYLDKIMAPIVKTLPSYIKDSQHALEIFRDFSFLDQNKLIFTMDITSLYTVIPNDEGLRALKHFFDQRTVKEPSSETLLRLAELVLTLNCFSFGGNYYKQTNGVAMGTKMGPSYANLFVGFIEHQFFSQYHGSTTVKLTIASALPPLPERSSLNL